MRGGEVWAEVSGVSICDCVADAEGGFRTRTNDAEAAL
jgi:hypothetical protein